MSMPPTSRAPERGDIVLAVVGTAIGLSLLALLPALGNLDDGSTGENPGPGDWQWWIAGLAVVAQGACLAWISSAPRQVLVAVAGIALLASFVPLAGTGGVHHVVVLVAAYVATQRRASGESWLPWVAAILLTAIGGVVINVQLNEGLLVPIGAAVAQSLFVVGIPTVIAAAVSARTEMRSSRERVALARAGELEARMDAALAAERTAIARELHDIAAHHLSGIALMSSAISQQIDTDPTTAKAGLADVRAQTRTLLDELRGLVALLRQDDGASVEIESLAGLETLIPGVAARGQDVSLTIAEGATIYSLSQGIGPLGQFAAYRTVQEALANTLRHAPGSRCTVSLGSAGDSLEILVTNGPGTAVVPSADAETGRGGFGLRGMEERASLTRSILTYGATDDGGWHVRLRVPRETGPGSHAPEGPQP